MEHGVFYSVEGVFTKYPTAGPSQLLSCRAGPLKGATPPTALSTESPWDTSISRM